MAIFDRKSRYVTPQLETFTAVDARGRLVRALPMAEPLPEVVLGEFVPQVGQRLDHLASAFLGDPHGYWRIVDASGALLPDALAEVERVVIPAPSGRRPQGG
jgi:hypothetical protein